MLPLPLSYFVLKQFFLANVKHFEVLPAAGHLKRIKISRDDKLKEPWTIKLGVPLHLKNHSWLHKWLHIF